MKRLVLVLSLLAGISVMGFSDAISDQFTNDMTGIFRSVTSNISTEMSKHMGFYTGDGNIYPVNTSGFLGIKFGIGVGVNTTPVLWKIVSDPKSVTNLVNSSSSNAGPVSAISSAFSVIPLPYDNIYFKIGLPVIPMDVGVRIGFIPGMGFPDVGGGNAIGIGQFHFGIEARYVLWELPGGFVKVDARLSYDNDSGSIGYTNTQTTSIYSNNIVVGSGSIKNALTYNWSGSSIGAKVMAGLNIPVVGSIYGGVGLNMNLGAVTTTFGASGSISGVTIPAFSVSNAQPYSAFDMRLIGGFNLLFITAAVEYNIFSQDLAINLIPFSMAF